MTFAAPLFAWIGAVAAAGVVGLHLLAWRRPPETPLPTARFAPERPIRMVSRALRPADLLLLALRTALVLLAGFALAGPRFDQRQNGSARVVVVDRSSAVGSAGDVLIVARRELRAGDALVVFDSSAREIAPSSLDSAVGPLSRVPGSISSALVAAVRAARRLGKERDTVELVVVSPFAAGEIDGATLSIRSVWSGPLRRVRVASAVDSALTPVVPELRGEPGDGVTAAVTLNGVVAGGGRVRIVRDSLTATDSATARDGRTIVYWPKAAANRMPTRPRADTAMAVTVSDPSAGAASENATVVAPFARASTPPAGRVIARWADGDAAATEIPLGAGCIRAVAIDVPSTGDLALTPSFRRFVRRMTEPCGGMAIVTLSDSVLERLLPSTVTGPRTASVASTSPGARGSRLTAWLLALALAAVAAEQLLRRRGDHASA